jgi:hypothetical protein
MAGRDGHMYGFAVESSLDPGIEMIPLNFTIGYT